MKQSGRSDALAGYPHSLAELLARVLAGHPGQTARDLVGELAAIGVPEVDRRAVNRVLYAFNKAFRSDHGTPPRWYSVEPAKREAVRTSTIEIGLPSLFEWQQEALEQWRRQGRRGIIEAVTGTGKTIVGIAAAAEELASGGQVLILVPTIELQNQWHRQLQRYLNGVRVGLLGGGERAGYRGHDVVVSVVNSAREANLMPVSGNGLLIADEVHRYGSERNKNALKVDYPRRLGLSATYARSDSGHLDWLVPYFGKVCFEMTYRRAIAQNVVAHFAVALVGVPLPTQDLATYRDLSRKLSKLKQELVEDHGVPEEPFGEFMKAVQRLAKGPRSRATVAAQQFLSAFTQRRRILAETPAKIDGVRKLADVIHAAKRTILFTQTIDSAETLAHTLARLGLAATAIHSRMDREERRDVLRRFGNGGLEALTAPQVLDEGIDVPEADLAVIVAASRTRRQMIQRMGRVLRRKADGRVAWFAVLYAEGTSEDPSTGAHEAFLNEITDVADAVRDFESSAMADEISAFLANTRPALAKSARSTPARAADRAMIEPLTSGHISLAKPSSQHVYSAKGVCIRCGCSRGAIAKFGWRCREPLSPVQAGSERLARSKSEVSASTPQVHMPSAKPDTQHVYSAKGVCIRCGCSRGAIAGFGWRCKEPLSHAESASLPAPNAMTEASRREKEELRTRAEKLAQNAVYNREAVEVNLRLLAHAGSDLDAMRRLGRICEEAKALADAREWYKRVLTMAPNDKLALQQLRRLDPLPTPRPGPAPRTTTIGARLYPGECHACGNLLAWDGVCIHCSR